MDVFDETLATSRQPHLCNSMWGQDRLRADRHEVGKCSTRGGSQGMYITFASAMRIRQPTLALKPRGDVTRNPKQGYQWPQKRTCVRQKLKKKKISGCIAYSFIRRLSLQRDVFTSISLAPGTNDRCVLDKFSNYKFQKAFDTMMSYLVIYLNYYQIFSFKLG